jgi:hypothetical protein
MIYTSNISPRNRFIFIDIVSFYMKLSNDIRDGGQKQSRSKYHQSTVRQQLGDVIETIAVENMQMYRIHGDV